MAFVCEKPHETKPLSRTAKLNPDTACFFARKHTHTQTQRRGENAKGISAPYGKAANACKRIRKKQPCIRKQLPGAAKQRLFQPYIHILHFCNDYVKRYETQNPNVSDKKVALGPPRPQSPRQRTSSSGHHQANWQNRKTDNFRLSLEDTKIGRLLAQESQENPLGQARFPQGIIPRLSPDAKHPGWRLSAAGPEAQRRLDWPFSQSISGKLSFFPVALFPQEQGSGRSPPWWRFGGKASKGS